MPNNPAVSNYGESLSIVQTNMSIVSQEVEDGGTDDVGLAAAVRLPPDRAAAAGVARPKGPHRPRVALRPRVEEEARLRIKTEGVLDLGRVGRVLEAAVVGPVQAIR